MEACPEGAVSVVDNRAVIDYEKCVGCVACTVSCRKKIIVDTYHDLTKVKPTVSFVRCRGGWYNHEVYAKAGATTCREAVKLDLLYHCNYGCAGFGDCVQACRFDALEIVQGTAKVDPDKCVGCKLCTKVCPRDAILPKATAEEKEKYKAIKKAQAENCLLYTSPSPRD